MGTVGHTLLKLVTAKGASRLKLPPEPMVRVAALGKLRSTLEPGGGRVRKKENGGNWPPTSPEIGAMKIVVLAFPDRGNDV